MGKGGKTGPIPGEHRRAPRRAPLPAPLAIAPPPPQPPPPPPPPPNVPPETVIPMDPMDMEMPPGPPQAMFNTHAVAYHIWNQAVNNGQGIGIPGVNQNPPPNQPQ